MAHKKIEVEDTVLGMIEYKNGALGCLTASTGLYPGTKMRLEIHGENGTAMVEGDEIALWQFKDEDPRDEEIRKIGQQEHSCAAAGAADFGYVEHRYLLEDVIDAIRNGRSPQVTGESSRATLEVISAMYESAEQNKRVELPLS